MNETAKRCIVNEIGKLRSYVRKLYIYIARRPTSTWCRIPHAGRTFRQHLDNYGVICFLTGAIYY